MGLGVCFTITLCRLTITSQSDDSNPSCVRGRVLRLIACWAATRHSRATSFQKASKNGPISARQRNVFQMTFRWRAKVARDRMLTGSWHAATGHAIDHIHYHHTTSHTTSRNTV